MAVNEPDDTGVSLADLEPTARQTWWAVVVATAAVVACRRSAICRNFRTTHRCFHPQTRSYPSATRNGVPLLRTPDPRSRALRPLLRLSLYGTHRHPTRAHVRGRFSRGLLGAGIQNWIMAVYLLAHRLRRGSARIRSSQTARPTNFGIVRSQCARRQHHCDGCARLWHHMAYHRWRGAAAANHPRRKPHELICHLPHLVHDPAFRRSHWCFGDRPAVGA